ncbi:hypothetical protein NPIL_525341 [Nephila pilipes]|uniref:Uncharacterized protein n=1 Tax=Nephila pilipes TaxID=299642 RepID=A0A8X6NMH5_NEPPI|nr:hypothetical protein NPIL_525341 [Nephila pilipes]
MAMEKEFSRRYIAAQYKSQLSTENPAISQQVRHNKFPTDPFKVAGQTVPYILKKEMTSFGEDCPSALEKSVITEPCLVHSYVRVALTNIYNVIVTLMAARGILTHQRRQAQ